MEAVRILSLDVEIAGPAYARPGDAGADLRSRVDLELPPSGGRAVIPTGIALELPDGLCALVLPRSGLAANHGVTCLNAPGLIDTGYRGEIQVVLLNTDRQSAYRVTRGDRIAQLLVLPFEQAQFISAESLSESARGAGGFGHTGR